MRASKKVNKREAVPKSKESQASQICRLVLECSTTKERGNMLLDYFDVKKIGNTKEHRSKGTECVTDLD